MDATPPRHLSPRKKPRQARSATTVETIFEATIQVLLSEGIHWLTTTRVAERAGVSVVTMYQYLPHKQALLYVPRLPPQYSQGALRSRKVLLPVPAVVSIVILRSA